MEDEAQKIAHKFRLSFQNRLKKRDSFLEIQESGKKFFSKHFILAIRESHDDNSRIGITVSKKVDKRAVIRNRIKRLIREIFRLNKHSFNLPYEIVIIAKKQAPSCSFHDIKREILGILYYNKFLKKH